MQAIRNDALIARVLRALVVTLLAIGILGIPPFAPRAAALTEEVEGLIGDPGGNEDGLVELSQWIGSLEGEGKFGRPLPLLDTSLGEALNLGETFTEVRTAIGGLTSTDVADLASDLAALDGGFGTPAVNVAFETASVDPTGPVVGFDLTMTATRSISAAALEITAPATTPDVTLTSVGSAGVPLAVSMTSLFTVRYDVDTNQFYVVENDQGTPSEDDDTPRFSAEAGVPDNTPASSFTFPASGFSAAIGFGDVTIEPTSTLALHATFFGDINDSNLDQELAFREPGNPGELIDAELRLPRSQNVVISRAGTVAASIDLDSPFTAANDDAVLQIPAPGNLDGADPVPTASGADLAELAQFGNVKPVDVVAGLVQYATLIRALQGNPNVDFDLPFLNGKLSDVVHVEEQLARFADDQVADGITPDTPISEMVEFDTALQLADHMQTGAESIADLQDTNGAATGKITPTYDAATDRLTFDIHILKTLDGSFGPFPELPADFEPPPGFESNAGLPNIGDELKDHTGLRAVTADAAAPSVAQRKTAYEFRLPFIVDLQNSVPATDIAETEGITEFESPMIHERFLTSTANSDDMKITGVVQTPVVASGQIGFVGVNIGGSGPLASTYTLDQTAAATPMLTVNVDATRATYDHDHDGDDGADPGDTAEIPFTATPRIVDLLLNLVDDPDSDNDGIPDASEPSPETDNDPVIPSQPSAKVDAVLKEQVKGPGTLAGDDYSLTTDPGTITIAWPNISTALAPANVTLDAAAQMLKKLDIVPNGDPTALLGKTLDKITNIADSIDDGLQTVGGVLGTDIPLLGASAKDLFTGAQTLIDEVEEFRTSPSPVTLQDLETSFQNALGDELGLDAAAKAQLLRFSLKDAIAGGEPELVLRLGFIDGGTEQVPLNLDIGFGDIVGANSGGTATLTTAADVKLNIPITLEAPSASDLTDADPQILNSSGFKISAEVSDQTGATKFGVNLGPLTLDLGQTPNGPQRYQFGAQFSALPGGTEVPEASETAQSLSAFFSSLTPAVTGAAGSPYDCLPPDDAADGATSAPDIEDAVLGCAALPIYLNNNPVTGDVDTSYLTVRVDDLTSAPTFTVPTGLETAFTSALFSFASMGDGLDKIKAILDLALKGATFGAKLPLIGEELEAGAEIIQKINDFVKNPLGTLGVVSPDVRVDWVDDNVRTPLANALTGAGLLRDSAYARTSDFGPDEDPADTTPGPTDIRLVMLCDGDKHVCHRDDPATTAANGDFDNDGIPNDTDPDDDNDLQLDEDDPDDDNDGIDDVDDDDTGNTNESEMITDLKEVTLEFEIGQGSRNPTDGDCAAGGDGSLPCPADGVDVPIDFALPGLNLQANQPAKAKAGWNLQLGFGVNTEDGFFLLDNPRPAFGAADDGASDPGEELKVGFGVKLAQAPGTAPELSGRIGFLDIEMEDTAGSDTNESHLNAGFDSNLTGSGSPVCEADTNPTIPQANCSRRITLAQLGGFNVADNLQPVVAADLDVDLRITTGLASFSSDSEDITEKLPKVQGDFDFTWAWTSAEPGSFGTPAISFTNVGINAGPFFSDVLQPIFTGVKRFTDPLKPIREFIFAPIPVLSDVSRLFGGGDITYVDLAEIFGDVDLSLLEDVDSLLDFIDTIGQLADGDNTFIPIGDGFTIDGARAIGPAATPDQAKSLIQNADDELNNTGSILGATKGAIDDPNPGTPENEKKEELDDLSGGSDISIPILEKPGCVFNMLVGGDCELFLYSPDPFEIEFDYEQPFGPFFGVLYVTIGGFAGARGTISAGYDTKGLRELIQKIGDGTATAGDAVSGLLEGIFLGDLDPDTGEDIAEFEVFAGITAGAKLSVVVAEAGVRGGVEATVGLNLHDGPDIDGKLRISEIRNKIAIPFCLFDVEGRLEAFLEVYLTLGVCPFCAEFDYELARVILLDFSEGFCPETVPNLASSSGGVIRLNAGIDAGARGSGWGNADVGPDENFVVRQLDSNTFSITAFGHTEEEDGSSFEIRDASDGNDTFLFQGLKTGGSPQAGTSSPAGQVNFTVPVVANLGGDNDSITTGTASDQVEGGSGNDSINVGDGDDGVKDAITTNDVSGGPGNDTISAGRGGDVVRGGGDADTIDGGVGADHLFGDDGVDRIIGGNNFIQVPGQSTPGDELDVGDKIVGGADADTIDGGDGGDEIYGDEEDSGLGDATANGEGAAGLATGGNDKITGGLGSDDIYAGNGADEATGAADATTVDNSSDDVFGNGGSDKLHGSLGGDNLYGGPDNDQVFGEGGDDNLFGQGGSDRLEGDVGADDLDGGPGDDERSAGGTAPDGVTPFKAGLSGGTGQDDIIGGSGEDDLFGLADEDFLMGDLGTIDDTNPAARVATPQQATGDADRLFGGTEADDLFGEGGTDEMHGDIGEDYMEGNGAVDHMFGDNDNDLMLGNDGDDVMHGGPDTDRMFGNDGDDTMLGQTGADKMIGGSEATSSEVGPSDTGDHMFGGTENDTMIGDNGNITSPPVLGLTGGVGTFGNDIMNGGPGDDLMHGQEGDDLMYGAENYDQMFGDLGDDDMFGESGHDYMLGDQGTIAPTPGASPSTYPSNDPGRGAVKNDVSLDDPADTEDPNDGGIDEMDGGTGDDHMYGGAANDIMEGGWDDDVMEGNGGRDSMYGATSTADDGVDQTSDVEDALFDGQDDMIGGSSDVNPETIDFDEGEIEMFGNAAQDVMTGDNANITRGTTDGGTLWAIDIVTGGIARNVELLDTEKTGAGLDEVSGNDYIQGNDQNDRIYGEGGNDCTKGNADEDYLEGNQDTDWVEGNDAQDDLIGGSAVDAQPDAGDYLHGGAAADVITGDNALVTREVGVVPVLGNSPTVTSPPDAYAFHTNRLEIPMQRTVQLLDLAAFVNDAAGPDQVSGGAGSDVLFGQDENDSVSGGSENDYMEGNGHTDTLWGDDLLADVPQTELDALEIPTACPSGALQLSGAQGDAGQDDQLGGSSIKNHRDDNDFIYGNGAQDFQLGDNGFLFRTVDDVSATTDAGYLHYLDANPDTIQRRAVRFDVGTTNTDVFGDDEMYGQDGDDYQYGQDGDDLQLGGNQNDDMFGELGDDEMYGEAGEDAMLGDRGVIVDDLIESSDADDPDEFTISTTSPPFLTYTAFRDGTLDRRFDLLADGDGDVDNDGNNVERPGLTHGGSDFMRGGPDHDSMHGAFGDDLMNGDSDGDILFGDDGSDAIWGGKGSDDQNSLDDRGTNDEFVDYIWGGFGGDPANDQGVITGGADVIDYRPRPGPDPDDPAQDSPDPASWFEITDTGDADVVNNQHHQGIDWIYGGWDRDVMQANIAENGPNPGDRLLDWTGAYNLYVHCPAAYGGYNDQRALSPIMIDFIQRWAFGSGIGSSLDDVETSGSSAFREVAIVFPNDNKNNSGKAYPTTPGHFEDFSCAP